MRDEREMERLLERVSVPNLRAGSHREQLKTELVDPIVCSRRKGEDTTNAKGSFRMTRLVKVAACVLIAASLVATGWAADKVYQRITKRSTYVELENYESPPVKFPDRRDGFLSSMSTSVVGTWLPEGAPPGSEEEVKRRHEIMKQLIAEKKYEFIKTLEIPPGSQTQYVYRFALPDGDHIAMNFCMRLENVTSWEDYLHESKEQLRQRNEKISKAIAAGRFRLLDVEPITTHVCRDADSDEKLLAQRIELSDGKEIASLRGEAAVKPEYQTSWQDHLKAIRQGERVLLDLRITENYTYEITLPDGTTTILTFGGSEPLKTTQG